MHARYALDREVTREKRRSLLRRCPSSMRSYEEVESLIRTGTRCIEREDFVVCSPRFL